MKKHRCAADLLAPALFLAAASAARATDLYWDSNGAASGIGNNGASTWANSAGKQNWSASSAGNTAALAWTDNDDAFFTGTAGTVPINALVVPRSISVLTNGYQFTTGNITLSSTANGNLSNAAPAIGSSLFIAPGVTATFQNKFVGAMDLNLLGAGTTLLSSANSFTGNISLNAGTLQLNDDSALGDANNTLLFHSGSTLQTTAAHTFSQPLALADDGDVAAYAFSGPMTFSGNTTIASGTSAINIAANSTLTFSGPVSSSRVLDIKGPGTLALTGTLSNALTGPFVIDAGTVQLAKSNNATAISGPITLNSSAVLALGSSNQIDDNVPLTVNSGAAFNLNDNSEVLGPLSGGGTISLGNGTLSTLTTTNTTFSGAIGGGGNLFKYGPGTLTLTGDSKYFGSLSVFNGPMTLSNGTIYLNATGATGFSGKSPLFVEGNASLTISAFALNTYGTPSVHNNGSILLTDSGANWGNLDGPSSPADIRIGYAGGTSTLTLRNGATVYSQSFVSIGGHILPSNPGVGAVYVQSGAELIAEKGLRMDAGSSLTVDNATAVTGALVSLAGAPSVFLSNQGSLSALSIYGSSVFNGNIADGPSGSGGLFLYGGANLTLAGQNTYTGTTYVSNANLTQSGGANHSPFGLSLGSAFVANNTTLFPLNGVGAISLDSTSTATYQSTTIYGGHLAGPGLHTFANATLNYTTIDFGAIAQIPSGQSYFTGVSLNGTLTSLGSLSWGSGSIGPGGYLALRSNATLSSVVSSGVLEVYSSSSPVLTINGSGLVLGAGSRTFIGSAVMPNAGTLAMNGASTQLNGGLLENYGAILGTLTINFGGVAEGPGTYTAIAVNPGGTLTLSSPQTLSSLLIAGGNVTITAGTTKTSALVFTGAPNAWSGRLELNGNPFILEAAAAKSSLLASLTNQIAYGKSHNAGITNSISLPAHSALAVIDNGTLATPFTTFAGLPVDGNSLLVTPALLGDANFDGTVNLADLNALLSHFGVTTPQWTSGNFTNSPTIDLTDLSLVLNNFGQSIGSPNTAPAPLPTPEPLSLTLLAPAVWSSAFSRRRTRGAAMRSKA